jgi:hypothetical protein
MSALSIAPSIGPLTYGQAAAQNYKAVPAGMKHATPVQYTPDFQRPSASNDLFSYAASFDENHDGKFDANEIQNASGLNLGKLASPQQIERLWDRAAKGYVDLKDMFVGLGQLDWADGAVDGKITEQGRNSVENNFFAAPRSPGWNNPNLYNEYIPANATFEDPTKFLEGRRANNPLAAGFSDSFVQAAASLQPLAGQNIRDTFNRDHQALLAKQDAEAQIRYQQQLNTVANAVDVQNRYNNFLGNPHNNPPIDDAASVSSGDQVILTPGSTRPPSPSLPGQ